MSNAVLDLDRCTSTGARCHPFMAPAGTWSPEAVVEAMQAWAAATGAPPRRYDFEPQLGRRLGLVGAQATRWEREHPRFPSRGVVEYHWGSWRAALAAAGLPYRSQPELPLGERVRAARRMITDGMSRAAVADVLGVSVGSVRNYLLAHPCTGCDEFVIRGEARLCTVCANAKTLAERPQRPTREQVIDAMQSWAVETGSPPRETDWHRGRRAHTRAGDKWNREYPRWPTTRDVYRHWSSWIDAVEEAALLPALRYWTREEADAALGSLAEQLGVTPTMSQLQDAAALRLVPSTHMIKQLYGSVRDAWRTLGLQPRRPARYTDEELVELLEDAVREYGRRPTEREWRRDRRTPDATTIRTRFGSFPAAFQRADRRRRARDGMDSWLPAGTDP
jgi:hypothetical protein